MYLCIFLLFFTFEPRFGDMHALSAPWASDDIYPLRLECALRFWLHWKKNMHLVSKLTNNKNRVFKTHFLPYKTHKGKKKEFLNQTEASSFTDREREIWLETQCTVFFV